MERFCTIRICHRCILF